MLCRSLMKAAFVLLPVLGITWVIGLLVINEDTVVFVWVFTVLNSLQVSYVYNYIAYINHGLLVFVTGDVYYGFVHF